MTSLPTLKSIEKIAANYGIIDAKTFAEKLYRDLNKLEKTRERRMETFEGAAQSACCFWETNNLNQWADKDYILTLTKRINGGTIGLEDRKKHWAHALDVLGGDFEEPDVDYNQTVRKGSRGPLVAEVQEKLGIEPADGIFGPGTERSIKAWQSSNGLVADGIVGPKTIKKLLG